MSPGRARSGCWRWPLCLAFPTRLPSCWLPCCGVAQLDGTSEALPGAAPQSSLSQAAWGGLRRHARPSASGREQCPGSPLPDHGSSLELAQGWHQATGARGVCGGPAPHAPSCPLLQGRLRLKPAPGPERHLSWGTTAQRAPLHLRLKPTCGDREASPPSLGSLSGQMSPSCPCGVSSSGPGYLSCCSNSSRQGRPPRHVALVGSPELALEPCSAGLEGSASGGDSCRLRGGLRPAGEPQPAAGGSPPWSRGQHGSVSPVAQEWGKRGRELQPEAPDPWVLGTSYHLEPDCRVLDSVQQDVGDSCVAMVPSRLSGQERGEMERS